MPNKLEKGELVRQNREAFVLLERTGETMPTNNEWVRARWRVAFLDRYNRYDDESQYYRWIDEVDVTPNDNIAGSIPGLDYFDRILKEAEEAKAEKAREAAEAKAEKARLAQEAKAIEGTDLNVGGFNEAIKELATVITTAKHRGRPAVGMNELKAKNAIRDYKHKRRDGNDPLVTEAFDWLFENGHEEYLEKHFV